MQGRHAVQWVCLGPPRMGCVTASYCCGAVSLCPLKAVNAVKPGRWSAGEASLHGRWCRGPDSRLLSVWPGSAACSSLPAFAFSLPFSRFIFILVVFFMRYFISVSFLRDLLSPSGTSVHVCPSHTVSGLCGALVLAHHRRTEKLVEILKHVCALTPPAFISRMFLNDSLPLSSSFLHLCLKYAFPSHKNKYYRKFRGFIFNSLLGILF